MRRLYAEKLESEGVIDNGYADDLSAQYIREVEDNQVVSRPTSDNPDMQHLVNWSPHVNCPWDEPCDTGVPAERLHALGARLTAIPETFDLHRTVKRVVDARREMANGEKPLDWGMAENLAYATLLEDGYPIRLSGQDCERGTFSHRHCTFHNQNERGTFQPLTEIADNQAPFRVINSVLSEEAVLAFEYGFSTAEPECLVLWEAQFGDFANGAQVVIDQFLSSSEAKWGRFCGLVMLLPHGYEGQGPEHCQHVWNGTCNFAPRTTFRFVSIDPRADVPHAAPADVTPVPQAADRDEPEESSASSSLRVGHDRPCGRQFSNPHR